MVPVWFTWFFIIGVAVCLLLLINEDKLLRMEAEYDKRKKERRLCNEKVSRYGKTAQKSR